jgi:protein-S-isoprenylcysteine O-methyltransferase Ste14
VKKGPLPPAYFGIAVLLMVALFGLLPGPRLVVGWPRFIGVVGLIAGLYLNIASDRLFKKYDTEVKPFRPSNALVVEGPYRYTRNPMYLGMALALLGIGILFGTLSPLIVVPLWCWVMNRRFIEPEERDMESQFGEQFTDYRRRVRRWF